MGGQAVFASVALGDDKRDAFTGLRIEAAGFGNPVKPKEGFQGIR